MANKISFDHQWDGSPARFHKQQKEYEIQFKFDIDTNEMVIMVDAPYFGDPAPSPTSTGNRHQLWDYEVVEIFIASGLFNIESKDNYYIEIILGPHGHYYICSFPSEGAWTEKNDQIFLEKRPVCTIDLTHMRWYGRISIPCYLIPEPLCGDNYESTLTSTWMLNAFAIHGQGESREYLAYNPVPIDPSRAHQPNFHQLCAFVPITINELFNDLATDESTDLHSDTISDDDIECRYLDTSSSYATATPSYTKSSTVPSKKKISKLSEMHFRPSAWDASSKKRAAALVPTVPTTIAEVSNISMMYSTRLKPLI